MIGKTLCALPLVLVTLPATAQDAAGTFFLSVWDLDHDGAVTVSELETMRGNVFNRFDVNGDDRLDVTEYGPFDAARDEEIADFETPEDQATMRQIADGLSLSANDADGDGAVSRAEFTEGAADWLASLDSDGNGAIEPADFPTE